MRFKEHILLAMLMVLFVLPTASSAIITDEFLEYGLPENSLQTQAKIDSTPLYQDVEFEPIFPQYQVWIPGLDNEDIITVGDDKNGCEKGFICIKTLSNYLNAIYRWGAGAGIVFAIVLMMIGGVEWMIGSAIGTIEKGKSRIKNASFGLLLLLGTTTILTFINPDIVALKAFDIKIVDYVQEINISGDVPVDELSSSSPTSVSPTAPLSSPTSVDLGTGATFGDMERLGILCPKSTSSESIKNIADSFIGKVSYRLGGKGKQQAPFEWELPPKSSEPKVDSASGALYGDFCSNSNMALDCSGYMEVLAMCAGLSPRSVGSNTDNIFANTPEITNCAADGVITLADGSEHELEPGDYVGWGAQHSKTTHSDFDNTTGMGTPFPPNGRSMNWGHIYMYIGDGMVTNSAGSGRATGTAVVHRTLGWACARYPLRLRALNT